MKYGTIYNDKISLAYFEDLFLERRENMFEKSRRFCAVLLAAVMIVTAFVGCGDDVSTSSNTGSTSGNEFNYGPIGLEGQNGTIHLKVWGPDAAMESLAKHCDEFCATMKDYATIKIEIVPQGEADPAAQLLNDAETAADVFGFASDSIDKLVATGALLEAAGANKDYIVENNVEGSVKAATVNGKLYAYPETGDNSYCLVYDKTIVSDEQAKTLEGVLEACKAKNKKFVMNAGDGYYSSMFLFTGGILTDGFEEDGSTQKFTPYNMNTASHTIMTFRELLGKYKDIFVNGDVTKVVDGFKSGTVGAGIDGSWNFSYAKETLGANAGFAVLPTISVDGVPTQIINMFGYKLIGVNSSTKYPNTSIALAKFLTGEECQRDRAIDLNWGPSNKNVAESTLVKSDAALSAILAQSENSVPQVGISASFWSPVATLGNIVVDFDTPMTEKECQELIKKTIANVQDK